MEISGGKVCMVCVVMSKLFFGNYLDCRLEKILATIYPATTKDQLAKHMPYLSLTNDETVSYMGEVSNKVRLDRYFVNVWFYCVCIVGVRKVASACANGVFMRSCESIEFQGYFL